MNTQERLKRKRKRQMYRRFQLMVPVFAVVLLIVGLTAAGVALSLNQTKKTGQDVSQNEGTKNEEEENIGLTVNDTENPEENQEQKDSQEDPEQNLADSAMGSLGQQETSGSEAETQEEVQQTPDSGLPIGEMDFAQLCSYIQEERAKDVSYLTWENGEFAEVKTAMEAMDVSALSSEEQDRYTILMDYMNMEAQGAAYSEYIFGENQRLCDMAGGQAYYQYLLQKQSGTGRSVDEVREILANDLNNNFRVISELEAADPAIKERMREITKSSANSEYLFGTLTAQSNRLLKDLACQGLVNGWVEFGLIRAYQTDEELDETMKTYAIDSTRMTYALYGLLDISVHYGAWGQEEVTQLCNDYFGGGQESFAQTMYQNILSNPGSYAASAIGYLDLVEIEAALYASTDPAVYTEQVLFDFLFARGPASIRVYRSWLGQ